MYALVNLHERPLEAADQRDLYSLGRVFEKRGKGERAKACFRLCRDSDGIWPSCACLKYSDVKGMRGKPLRGMSTLRLSGARRSI